jgi:hypothetical protein
MDSSGIRFRGLKFTFKEIELIRDIIRVHGQRGRKGIARLVCQALNWRGLNHRLKVTAALEVLRRIKEGFFYFASESS